MNLTAIITCKNRLDNLKLCLASIRACGPRPRTIVVDFGSDTPVEFPEYKSWVRIIRVTRDTDLFHKARAINIGIKNVTTRFLCITDADQMFQPNFFGVVKQTLQKIPNTFVMCKSHFLPTMPAFTSFSCNGKEYYKFLEKAKQSGILPHGDGCCNGVSTKWALNAHGYDESYVGYRAQDSDFALRAVASGLQKVWVTNSTSTIHLPHKRIGEYYSNDFVVKNKKMFYATRAVISKKLVIANKKNVWGQL